MSYLDSIIAYKKKEVGRFKEKTPYSELERYIDIVLSEARELPSMKQSVVGGSGIISEFKRKSPSKGWIKENGKAEEIPLMYQENGASAISILTDKKFFAGSDDFIRIARKSGVVIPVLYKNFVIDEYQLLQARLCGASSVLLIAAALKKSDYANLLHKAHELGMEALLEVHSKEELDYLDYMPDLCGVNNRNLVSFITDVEASFQLASLMPSDIVKVSESGIDNPSVVRNLRLAGYNGFLIGEYFMRQSNPGEALASFIAESKL